MQSVDDTQRGRESAVPSTRASSPSWRQRCAATLLSALLGWICIELILRWLSLPKPEPSPMRFVGDALKWAAIDRVWIGGHLARHEVIDDQRLRCELEAPLPPGEHEIFLVGANGAVTADVRVMVPPPSLKAVVTRGGGGLHLEVSGTAPPRSRILVWLRPGRASVAPLATQSGPFVLADDDRRAYGPPDWFCFKKLSLLTIAAVNDATPTWQASHEGELPDGMQEISLQALITSQGTSALSESVTLRLTP